MAVGGATWDTAGTLDLGSGNTFDPADATEGGDFGLLDVGWWSFTPAASGDATIESDTGLSVLYRGATFDDREVMAGGGGAGTTYRVQAGVTYHFVTGHFGSAPPSYTVTLNFAVLNASPWFDNQQDDPNNYVIISEGAVNDQNPNPDYRGTQPEWTHQVIRGGQERRGDYTAYEVLGGAPVIAARDCVVGHAIWGDQGSQSWNDTGTGPDPGTPVCKPLPPRGSLADAGVSSTSTTASVDYGDSDGLFLAGHISAIWAGPSYGVWFLPVRDNLPPNGVLDPPSPADYGYPDDATLEWEESTVGLVAVYIGDGNPVAGPVTHTNDWVLNGKYAPLWEDGDTSPWRYGPHSEPPDGPVILDRPWVPFAYSDGADPEGEWTLIPGTDQWREVWTEDYAGTGDQPAESDGIASAWPLGATGEDPDNFTSTRVAQPALKYVLQARRFRFVYEGGVTPPRRIFGRSDGLTHGARRTTGGGNTVQAGNRTVGGIL